MMKCTVIYTRKRARFLREAEQPLPHDNGLPQQTTYLLVLCTFYDNPNQSPQLLTIWVLNNKLQVYI